MNELKPILFPVRMLTKSEVEELRQDLKNSIGMLGKLESQNEQL